MFRERRSGLFVVLCLFILISGLLAGSSAAQDSSSLAGTVVDSSGAVIVAATVTLTAPDGTTKTATTDEQGGYLFPGLPPGTYSFTVTAAGFQDYKSEPVTIVAGQPSRVDVGLVPASVATTTTVEGQTGAQVETEQSQIAGTITQKELVKIGLNGRNFTQLIALSPGVSNQTGQDEAKVGVQGSVKYSVNGGRVEYNNFEVDGNDVLNAGINGSQSTLIVYPSLDAIGDVQVLTSNYGAQYGKTASGTIIASLKSGGDSFHGNVYYFNRNEIFNARNFFDQTRRAPLYRKNDVGYTLGGRLLIPGVLEKESRIKTYFFWSQEFRIEADPTGYTFNKAVPSLAERAGDFSDVCPKLNPNGNPPVNTAIFSRTKFPDCPGIIGTRDINGNVTFGTFSFNQVPLTTVGQAIVATGLIPAPNATKGCNSSIGSCFDATISPDTNWREELLRVDNDFGANTRLTFEYIHDTWSTTVPLPQWAFLTNSYPTVQNNFVGPGLALNLKLSQTLSTTLLNQLSFGYTTDHISLTNIPGYAGASSVRTPGFDTMGSIFNNGFGGKVPSIAAYGNNQVYGGSGFLVDTSYTPWFHSNPSYKINENMTKVWRKHTFQFGALFIIAQRNQVDQPVGSITGDVQGILGFSNTNNIFAATGNVFADLLTGDVFNFTQDSAQNKYFQRYRIAEPYFQDDWHITRRLTLNLGLRLSLFGNWHEKYNNLYNWVPSKFDSALASTATVAPTLGELIDNATGAPIHIDVNNPDPRLINGLVRCGTNGLPSSCIKDHKFNPEPRIGFAWDPFGKGKTSVRGGYGIFFEHGTGAEANTGSLEGSAPVVLNMQQIYPPGPNGYDNIGTVFGRIPVGTGKNAAFPLNVTSIPYDTPYPYVQQWSFGVQHELPGHFVSSFSYVGSKATHLTAQLQINQLHPVAESLNPFLANQPISFGTCAAFNNTLPLSEGFDGINFHENGTVIGPSDPAYPNMVIACDGTNNLSPFPVPNHFRSVAPTLGKIYSLQNIANSNYHALQATVRKVAGPLTMSLSYSYSHSIDDSSDRTDTTFVNSFDIQANRASSNFDQRHLLAISYIYQIPLYRIFTSFNGWADSDSTNQLATHSATSASTGDSRLKKFLDGWEFSGITVYQSGTPFTIINGASPTGVSTTDNAGVANGIGVSSFPDRNPNPVAPVNAAAESNTFGPLLGNPNEFVAPRGLTFGNVGRNSFNNPGRTNFDMALLKTFRVWESKSLEFRLETFNTFNHTQFRIYNPDRGNVNNTVSCYGGPDNTAGFVGNGTNCLGGSSFLHPVDAHRPRTMQLGLKFQF